LRLLLWRSLSFRFRFLKIGSGLRQFPLEVRKQPLSFSQLVLSRCSSSLVGNGRIHLVGDIVDLQLQRSLLIFQGSHFESKLLSLVIRRRCRCFGSRGDRRSGC